MSPRFKVVITLLVSATAFGMLLPSVSARKKPRPTPTPQVTPNATPLPTATSTPEQQNTEAIYEAVLRSSFGRGGKCYLSLAGQDPTPTFIERMARQGIRIEPISRSPIPHARGRGDASRLRQSQITLSQPKWLSSTKAEVNYSDVGSGTLFVVEKQDNAWKVTKRNPVWIS